MRRLFKLFHRSTRDRLDSLLEINWLLLFLLAPVFFFPWVYNTWTIGRYFLIQVLIESLIFIWLLKIILQKEFELKKITFKTIKDFFQSQSGLQFLIPVLLFALILIITTIFSTNPYYSFWGYYRRKTGLLFWLHLIGFYLVLFFNLKTKKQIKRILNSILIATAIVTIYGLIQILGLDFLKWTEDLGFSQRVISTMGQPNFLASWFCLSFPIIIWMLIKMKNQFAQKLTWQKLIIFCLFIFSFFVFVLTQSRGAWIGLFLSLFGLVVILCWLMNQKRLAILITILLLTIFAFLVYLNLNSLEIRSDDSFLTVRFKSMTQLNLAGQLRMKYWKASMDLIQKKPWLGYGIETQCLLFYKYYEPEMAALEKINAFSDRAHNDILDWWLMTGIFGLIVYLFIIIQTLFYGIRTVFRQIKRPLDLQGLPLIILILCTGIFAYIISLQFSFHVGSTALYFMGFLAIIHVYLKNKI